jgi:hypothetical protein
MSHEVRRPQDLAERVAERRSRQRWLGVFGRSNAMLTSELADDSESSSDTSATARISSDQQPERVIEASVSEVALMWVLHQRILSREPGSMPLDQQILGFSDAALSSIRSDLHYLQNVEEAHLWLVYFKGLITAKTHPREQMVRAINIVHDRHLERQLVVVPHRETQSFDDRSDDETLAHIAEALEANKNEAGISWIAAKSTGRADAGKVDRLG